MPENQETPPQDKEPGKSKAAKLFKSSSTTPPTPEEIAEAEREAHSEPGQVRPPNAGGTEDRFAPGTEGTDKKAAEPANEVQSSKDDGVIIIQGEPVDEDENPFSERNRRSKSGDGEPISTTEAAAAGVIGGMAAGSHKRESSRTSEKHSNKREEPVPEKRNGEGGREEKKKNEEKPRRRSFNEIQEEFRQLINRPNPTRERELRMERARLLQDAKDAGVFKSLKETLADAQRSNDFMKARELILGINIQNREDEEKGGKDWSDDFEGMLDEYRDVAILNMDLAFLRATGEGNSPEAQALLREIEIRGWSEAPLGLEGMARKYLEGLRPETHQNNSTDDDSSVKDLLERQVELQEAQYELMRKGLKGFIQGVAARAHVNPEQYDQSLPPWFEELEQDDKDMLRNLLHINYLASIKRDTGMMTLDSWAGTQGLRVERESLARMVETLPGFRVALATMVRDIFNPATNQDDEHLVISGVPEDREKGIVATGGYAIVGSEAKLNAYKKQLVSRISGFLDNVYGDRYEKSMRVTNFDLATLAVHSVDNLFFGFGAYDSGDEKRKITPGDQNVYSEQVRTLFMPGIKGWAKWKGERDSEGVSEEDFGGPLGSYLRDNIAERRGGFRKKVESGEISFIPKRLFYSVFDHIRISKHPSLNYPTSEYRNNTLAQALLRARKVDMLFDLADFEGGANGVPIRDVVPGELLGDYGDTRSSVIKLFKHITGKSPDDRIKGGPEELVNALIKMRKDPLLNKIARNEDFVMANIIMLASPAKGLVVGTDQTVLDVPENGYDSDMYNAIYDGRIFQGMKSGAKNRISKKLHYKGIFSEGNRSRIVKQANFNVSLAPTFLGKTLRTIRGWLGR